MLPAARPLRIGIAACFMDADPSRPVFKGKTLLYLEESLSHWLMTRSGKREAGSVVPMMLPTPSSALGAEHLMAAVDGLVLQGGVDVSPTSYGEQPLRPQWAGDRLRDEYESVLIRAAMALDRPVLGICRGLQIINVALGGSLYQDITTQLPDASLHRDYDQYDRLHHEVCFEPDSWLAARYPEQRGGRVNTVHHQGIKQLGKGLRVEARSVADGFIEAIRYDANNAEGEGGGVRSFVYGVQWHPEYQDPEDDSLLSTAPLREMFLDAVHEKWEAGSGKR